MKITDYLSNKNIIFGIKSIEKDDILMELAKNFENEDNVLKENQLNIFVKDLIEREKLASTGMQDGIAIPHAKSSSIKKLTLLLAIDKVGKDFDSIDEEPSKLFFLIAAPEDCKKEHLDLLQKISKLSFEEEILEKIINSIDKNEILQLLERV